jgi:hypothetical protein
VAPLIRRYQSCPFSFTILPVIILSTREARRRLGILRTWVEQRFSAAFQTLFSVVALAAEVTTIE